MKFSTTLSLGVAHLAVAKSVHNVAPVAKRNVAVVNGVSASPVDLQRLQSLLGLNPGSGVSVNFLWVNLGGGQATTVLNQAQTVTVTQTVAGAAATPPVAGNPGEVAASPTLVPGGGAGTPVAPGTGATHSVTVGGPQGLSFNPQVLRPAVGDTLIFTFLSQNHTVTQSAFETPCDPLAGGMDSGYQANPNNTVNPPPQVAMQVMVNTPLWFYCRQGPHCGKGMVFSVNPTAEKTHAMFQALAISQKGQGGGSAITGGAPAAAAPPAAGAPPPAAGAVASGTAPNGAQNTGFVQGVGTLDGEGNCQCVVSCQFNGDFPVAAQGAGNFGGLPGGVPMAAAAPPARRV
ncbi:hypothetical protein QBC39DRAFT_174554 [Podospora conica]|nr:hypothetical protein QBC39DRAFT_174554 [Schizothecium conicum]